MTAYRAIRYTVQTVDSDSWDANETTVDRYTVIHTDRHGEEHDLSAQNPCESVADLQGFIRELHEQGFFSESVRDDLLNEVPELN